MKFNPLSFFFVVMLLCSVSCTSYRKVPYLQTKEKAEVIELASLLGESMVRICPDDVLFVTVNTTGESAVAYDYNLPLQPAATTHGSDSYVDQGIGRQSYLVNKAGEIDFPVMGMIKVSGYTREELEQVLKDKLRNYLKVSPIVTVQLMNFKISVLGEVNRPGQLSVSKDHINILEALALAGDMTLYGKRDKVKLIRQSPNGETKIITVDISDAKIVSSPYFYLQQNDILYVVPSSIKTIASYAGSQIGLISSVLSVTLTVLTYISLSRR